MQMKRGKANVFLDLSDSCDRLDVDMVDSVLYARLSRAIIYQPIILLGRLSHYDCQRRITAKKASDKDASGDANYKAVVARLKTVIAIFQYDNQ